MLAQSYRRMWFVWSKFWSSTPSLLLSLSFCGRDLFEISCVELG